MQPDLVEPGEMGMISMYVTCVHYNFGSGRVPFDFCCFIMYTYQRLQIVCSKVVAEGLASFDSFDCKAFVHFIIYSLRDFMPVLVM